MGQKGADGHFSTASFLDLRAVLPTPPGGFTTEEDRGYRDLSISLYA